jgi:hypothetical protein
MDLPPTFPRHAPPAARQNIAKDATATRLATDSGPGFRNRPQKLPVPARLVAVIRIRCMMCGQDHYVARRASIGFVRAACRAGQ